MTDPQPPRERDEQREQEKWYETTRYQIILFTGGIALFGLVLGLILDWYIDPQTSTQKKDLVQALGLITAGVAGAVGIFFTWRGQRLAREAQEENQENTLQQLEQSRNELDITRRGQITERFTQAIDQLGSESLEIRLGGIYSLERTAREDRDYHWPIMEVLATYIRTHAPRQNPERDHEAPYPQPDIQAILTVIGRRSIHHRDVEYGPVDLHLTDLTSAVLREANLSRAKFRAAILREAILPEANLSIADLSGADLRDANLLGADLSGAKLSASASLAGAVLRHATLRGADLSYADLSYADLTEADLAGADLFEAKITQAQLDKTTGDERTRLPSNLKPPAHWGVKTGEHTKED